jgi:hypothetical protein
MPTRLNKTAMAVAKDWRDTVVALLRNGQDALATEVMRFAGRLGTTKVITELTP